MVERNILDDFIIDEAVAKRAAAAFAAHFDRYYVLAEEPKEVVTDRNRDPRPNPVGDHVRDVIKDLTDRAVGEPDRKDLRKALDTADAPESDRKEADKALGRISIGR